jgi:hypothetical protein
MKKDFLNPENAVDYMKRSNATSWRTIGDGNLITSRFG